MPQLFNERAQLLSNAMIGQSLYLMVLRSPKIALLVQPGQFVHLMIPGMEGHILRRPFSVYACNREQGTIDILFQDVGFGSHRMTMLDPAVPADCEIDLIGPVGNTWSAATAIEHGEKPRMLLVGGGVGAAPLFMLASALEQNGAPYDVVIGAQTKGALVTRERYAELMGCEPFCSTDDGTYGRPGFCTSLVEERLADGCTLDGKPYDQVVVCGPTPLMKIVVEMAKLSNIPCEVSLERRMACGIGACLSCVVDTVEGKKRACVDGPIFDAGEVIW